MREYNKESLMDHMTLENKEIKILFVCMGNICRSPLAASILKVKLLNYPHLEKNVLVDSAGTHTINVGETVPPKLVKAAYSKGYCIEHHKSREIAGADFLIFDFILAMDWDVLAILQRQSPKKYLYKLHLLMRFASNSVAANVPDPCEDFSKYKSTLKDLEDANEGLLDILNNRISKVA